jgi:hypothetical protein
MTCAHAARKKERADMAFRYENLFVGMIDDTAPCTATCGVTCVGSVVCPTASSCEAPSVDTGHVDKILSQVGKQELQQLHEVLTTLQQHLDPYLQAANAQAANDAGAALASPGK